MKECIFDKTDFSIWRLPVGQMQTNCYLLVDTQSQETLVIDPGDDAQYIIETTTSLGLTVTAIVATHGHFDHVMAGFEVQQTLNAPFFMHSADQFLLDRMGETAEHFLGIKVVEPPPTRSRDLKDGEILAIGSVKVKIHETPGHTPGSVCLEVVDKNILIAGDTIFAEGGVGRTDFSYSDSELLKRSLTRILSFPDDMILLPGHGNDTTIAQEKGLH